MSQADKSASTIIMSAEDAKKQPVRARVGYVVENKNTASTIQHIVDAEQAGLQQIWITQNPFISDVLGLFVAAGQQTSHIRLGTAIVPTYPRHPLILAQQALTINDVAPGRLRLGIGPSHKPMIEEIYGIPQTRPLAHLREYTGIVRSALWNGKVEHNGDFFRVKVQLPRTAKVPILVSALGEKAFYTAGEISDGALSWICPVPYLLQKALPALQSGAKAQQRPVPPLVAHISVALSQDHAAVQQATQKPLSFYTQLPFYAHMFAEAGYPVGSDGKGLDRLVDGLVIHGDESTVTQRLQELLQSGLDELLVMLIPVANENEERTRLMKLIGSLS